MTSVLEFCARHTKLAQSQFIDRWMAGLKNFNGAFHIYQTCLAHISQAKKCLFILSAGLKSIERIYYSYSVQ